MKKLKISAIFFLLFAVLVLPNISKGQTQLNLSSIDCSKYSSPTEKLMCTYLNTLIQMYLLLLQQLKNISPAPQPTPLPNPVPTQTSITIISPSPLGEKGGLDIAPGTNYKIQWTSTNVNKVLIYLCDYNNTCKILSYIPDSGIDASLGYFNWYVDPNNPLIPGGNLRLKIVDASNPNVYSYSGWFSIGISPQPSITVLSPNGGETFNKEKGAFYASWKNTTGKGVDIYLLSDDKSTVLQTIAKNFQNANYYFINIDPSLLVKDVNRFVLRVCGTNTSNCDDSDNYFSFVAFATQPNPSITVLSPNGGEVWQVGSIQKIKWNPTNGYNYVIVDLVRGANNTYVKSISIGNSISTGELAWQVPLDIPTGNDYKIYINASNAVGIYTNVSDVSDAFFSIVTSGNNYPSATVLSPSNGANLTSGSQQTISWKTENYTGNVDLDLLQNNNFVMNIASNISNTGYYNWTIPSNLSGSGFQIKITLLSVKDGLDAYNSGYFNINLSTLTQPKLSINKTNFLLSDTWILTLGGAPANQPVYICAIDNRGVQSCTPTGNLNLPASTDLFGSWSATGNWKKADGTLDESVLGTWTEWIEVGGLKSNTIQFSITKPTSFLDSLNQMANILNSLQSIINQFNR
ncbi:MAG: GPI anchored serine-threonine rich family protein [Minisyncoccia bacterium]